MRSGAHMSEIFVPFLKNVVLGPDIPQKVGGGYLECSGERKGPGGDIFPKNVRDLEVLELSSLHSPASAGSSSSSFSTCPSPDF